MALQAHLTSPDHAGLAFHPGCPLCRAERLSGTLPGRAIVGPRARALLAAGILAGSTGASTAGPAVAQTPEETELGGLLDQLDAVPVTPEEQAEIDVDAAVPEEPVEPVAPPPAPVQAPPPAPPPAASRPAPAPKPKRERRAVRPAPRTAPAPMPVSTPAQIVPVAAVPGATHVVRPGESLWSIAADLLGPRASNAAVAREVARIWALNADAIRTGDPDLLIAGQRLRLPRG